MVDEIKKYKLNQKYTSQERDILFHIYHYRLPIVDEMSLFVLLDEGVYFEPGPYAKSLEWILYDLPLEDMPLYIASDITEGISYIIRSIAEWRLKILK